MKKLNALLGLFALCLFILNMESCSTKQGMVSCPDLHRAVHHQMAMHKVHHPSDHTAIAQQNTKEQPQNAATDKKTAKTDAITPVGTASISSDVPVVKHPKDIFKILTSDERQQVKDQLSNMLAKRPMLKNMALKRFDKLDKKYPAPAESVLNKNGGGGSLGIGEILAIVAIVLSLTFFLSIAGLIIGIVALIKINHDGGANWAKILAIVAIIVGALMFIGFLAWLILIIAVHSVI